MKSPEPLPTDLKDCQKRILEVEDNNYLLQADLLEQMIIDEYPDSSDRVLKYRNLYASHIKEQETKWGSFKNIPLQDKREYSYVLAVTIEELLFTLRKTSSKV